MIKVISFGYLHAGPPQADLVVDVRPFRDPHLNPALRELTAADQAVADAVMATPGIRGLIYVIAEQAAELAGSGSFPVTVAIGCAGGRHRAPAVAEAVAGLLRQNAYGANRVIVTHRDTDKPVVRRAPGAVA